MPPVARVLVSFGGSPKRLREAARSIGVGVQRESVGFERAGLERERFIPELRFRLERGGLSRAVIRLGVERAGFCRAFGYSFRYSRSRRVCVRLTGISVDFSSFIRRM